MKELFGIEIKENENGFLSVSDLQTAYDSIKDDYGWGRFNTPHLLQTYNFKHSIFKFIKFDGNEFGNDIDLYNETVSNTGVTKFLKKEGYWKTIGRGETRKVYCDERIWKMIFINAFSEFTDMNMPEWIRKINLDAYSFSCKKSDTRESHFIDNLLQQVNLFLECPPQRQFKIENYRYDLMLNILDNHIIIEYQDPYHSKEDIAKIDYEKAIEAYYNHFYIIHVPNNKEHCVRDTLIEIIKGKQNLDINFEFSMTRFKDMREDLKELISKEFPDINYKKYVEQINIGVFGEHSTGCRYMATQKELQRIQDVENFLYQSMLMGYINSDVQMTEIIIKYFK